MREREEGRRKAKKRRIEGREEDCEKGIFRKGERGIRRGGRRKRRREMSEN